MPFLTNPSRPKPPRLNNGTQIPRQDSQTTLREEPEERYNDDDHMEYDYAPPPPPKLDTSYAQKSLPITPMDSPQDVYHVGGLPFQMQRARTTPRNPKPSTSNRWKSTMGKILTLRRSNQNTKARKHLTPPPLSPASSRQPSFYVPNRRDYKPHRSAVTLLTSASSTQHSQEDYDEDLVTNIGLSRSSLIQATPVTPVTRGGYHVDHFENISAVLQRADTIIVPSPITPYTPYSPVRRSPTGPTLRRDTTSRVPPRSATPHLANQRHQHSMSTSTPSPSPPPVWPAPGSPPLIVTNPTPSSSPAPILVKRSNTRASQPPRPKLRTTTSAGTMLPPLTTAQKRVGPRILQAQLPSPISPDPTKHVFTGPWLNRRGDEWIGISSVPGEYRVKAVKEGNAFDAKFMNYPEEMHHFMNPMGDVMDAKTLGMVSKAARP